MTFVPARARVQNPKLPSVDGGPFYKGFFHIWQCQVWAKMPIFPHLAPSLCQVWKKCP
jgi:hypothetical protein